MRLTALFIVNLRDLRGGAARAHHAGRPRYELQRQQTRAAIDREAVASSGGIDSDGGFRATIIARAASSASQPGPGIYYLADPAGQMIVGNVTDLPPEVLAEPGTYSFNYYRAPAVRRSGRARPTTRRRSARAAWCARTS